MSFQVLLDSKGRVGGREKPPEVQRHTYMLYQQQRASRGGWRCMSEKGKSAENGRVFGERMRLAVPSQGQSDVCK